MDAGTISTFDPSSDADSFRGALGTFVTGVTIVTTDSPEGPVAIVANSFASVSLDPPLVLWSPAKASKRFEHFAGSRRFAVHVLAADQRDVCAAILGSKTAIKDVPMHLSHCGMPIIEGALASFECNLEATHDAGDHVIVVGLVKKAHHRGGPPLVFHGGKYGAFSEA
ncbi:flavin reductase family protein [Yoonia sediminilitoris]|uniref:Flavin reductase (DIM6/NTAB) family NADH-FMN oxidoreductase RutF n=1 Tax=Yoonia sediminilitoris TaxID=1286148 RepID=A0A2T6KQS9_9RHOB|nr:flavin reductase family protein [Yoonia sediminilitoris]PUB18907.1 flavin reductase (DIM6/NTAB) family NADH-FMN oxidoreductase RutF [Yoonia sediminilitoris]RCW99075.1 flavin reductase (DIM6/NTAB) family NADH-FMN oxidoreductase RutF [Yoonia sediminilitoris]